MSNGIIFNGDARQLFRGQISNNLIPIQLTGHTYEGYTLGNIVSQSTSNFLLCSNNLSDLTNVSTALSNLGLAKPIWSILASKIPIGTGTTLTLNNSGVGWSTSTYSLFKIVFHNVIGNNQGTSSILQCQILTPSTAITSTYLSGLNYNEYNVSTSTNVNSTGYMLLGAGGNHTSGILYIDMNTLMSYGNVTSSDGSGNPYYNTIQSIISSSVPSDIGFEFSWSNGASFYEESPNTSISIYGLSQG